jgi:hypothetical protein
MVFGGRLAHFSSFAATDPAVDFGAFVFGVALLFVLGDSMFVLGRSRSEAPWERLH